MLLLAEAGQNSGLGMILLKQNFNNRLLLVGKKRKNETQNPQQKIPGAVPEETPRPWHLRRGFFVDAPATKETGGKEVP